MIRNAPQLYAHAIAMEREAAQRYGELAERMQRLGHVAVAEVFDRLSQWEAEHLEALLARTQEIAIPEVAPGEYRWLDAGGPERASAPLELPLLTPRQALGIALAAECRAQVFFETAFLCADDPAVRALAREMAMEETGHIALIEALLQASAAPLDARAEYFFRAHATQGKQIEMLSFSIRTVMEPRSLIVAPPQASVSEASRLMCEGKVGAVLVIEDDRLVGIFTERDVVYRVIAAGRDPATTVLREVMTRDPKTVAPEESFGYALLLMHENGFRHAPVVKDGKVLGVVSARNALDPELEEFVAEAERRKHIRRHA